MKKLCLAICLFLLFGCEVGKFPEEREALHKSVPDNFCEVHPERCVNNVPW